MSTGMDPTGLRVLLFDTEEHEQRTGEHILTGAFDNYNGKQVPFNYILPNGSKIEMGHATIQISQRKVYANCVFDPEFMASLGVSQEECVSWLTRCWGMYLYR